VNAIAGGSGACAWSGHSIPCTSLLEQYRGSQRFALWLKVDTRHEPLRAAHDAVQESWDQLQALRPAPLTLRVLTHLACADERGSTPRLGSWRDSPAGAGRGAEYRSPIPPRLAHPATHADWVRPGLALYGASPFAGEVGTAQGLTAAMTLESTVIAVRQIDSGECVGYGAAWRAARASRIAILAGGYGDGLLRSLSNGAPVMIRGQRAPLVGRVSMDMIAVDVTDLPPLSIGERAELWGRSLAVEEVAAAAGTITSELLCGVSRRVPIELA
jgi:alanine racemase